MAESFTKIKSLKGAVEGNLEPIINQISVPFNKSSESVNTFAEMVRGELLTPVREAQALLKAATDAFLRRRAMVTRRYKLVNTVEKSASYVEVQSKSLTEEYRK